MTYEDIDIWTDGACSRNPGPGGWGVLIKFHNSEKELCGGAFNTTNNRMELQAAIEALIALNQPCNVCLHTDSQYLKDGITNWIHVWKKNSWKTSAKKIVKNADLWSALDDATSRHIIRWCWVRGHAGQEENSRADGLAQQGMKPYKDGGWQYSSFFEKEGTE
ncbi:ribonuclease HI [Candidatus Endowatersipora endosymbiont of Watersipora subatra]|uniref:ribonuclease HI n=1 Tax=Candidatus Endowatersipora endosymbiont of Watersipora subatra TaxID=3077946 RepID=UPI00312C8E40